ncbi:MAG: hypothetical protein U1F77_06165 [Kiritimatiellia bacterium]
MYAATGMTFRGKVEYLVKVPRNASRSWRGMFSSAFPRRKSDRLENPPYESNVPRITPSTRSWRACWMRINGAHAGAGHCGKMSDYFAGRVAKLTPEQIEAMPGRTAGPSRNEFGGMGGR